MRIPPLARKGALAEFEAINADHVAHSNKSLNVNILPATGHVLA